jgi:carbon monoxide dehydrogenase subunit G
VRIVIVLAVLVAAVLAYAATRPDTIRITRSTLIKASPEAIFALINDFHNWIRWAPQDREDPSMMRTYSGPTSGVGSISDWESKGSAGKGRMSIVEASPPTKISIKVDFVKPFEAHNLNQFTLEPDGSSTKVTWTMRGTNVYMTKVMSVFVNVDRLMGKHFESGLGDLKAIAEK